MSIVFVSLNYLPLPVSNAAKLPGRIRFPFG